LLWASGVQIWVSDARCKGFWPEGNTEFVLLLIAVREDVFQFL
jgi:hypothetical protein